MSMIEIHVGLGVTACCDIRLTEALRPTVRAPVKPTVATRGVVKGSSV